MADAHVRARGLFASVEHPVLGRYEQVSFPAIFDGERIPPKAPPTLGQHNAAILEELFAATDPVRAADSSNGDDLLGKDR
jgi:crotonobetainyl-CoA:carnitine CoA-transferase CaiB-like acyl-CoA transferase